MRCKHRNRRNKMKAAFFKDGSPLVIDTNHQSQRAEMTISSVSKSDEGTYTCEFSDGAESEAKELRVKTRRRLVKLRADQTTIPVGGHVTLTCDVEDAIGLSVGQNLWVRYSSDPSEEPVDIENGYQYDISHGGKYTCQGWRKEPDFFTSQSNAVIIQETVSNKATVTLQPNWPQIFSGEKKTLRCEIQGGGDTGWTYEWSTTSRYARPAQKEYTIDSATEYHRGQYSCRGRRVSYSSTQWSDVITLTVLSYRPWARLSADNKDIPVGGSVTLTCSVNPSSSSSSSSSSGWTYFWYRGEKTSELLASQDYVFLSNGQIRVSQGGLYWCRGGRGDPVYYTEYSGSIRINKIISNKATVIFQPNWPQIFSGEKMTLRCEIQGGGDTGWTYEWSTTSQYTPRTGKDYIISSAAWYHSGEYRCVGRRGSYSSTQWSDVITLTVLYKPRPVLTVSPLWLSPGASVTLSCSVEHPSAGWRFFWYKAVPKLSDNSYSYELIPGSINGTEQDSYIVDGQTHTAGYVCRAGRGDPVYYTHYSGPKFVWSGDVHSSASLMVSPDRVQHFTSDSVSLNCEGNSTEWRVKKLTESGSILFCQNWGTMTGSTCSIKRYWSSNAVYWCESGSGEFSNAVNITISSNHIILVSPVRPVTEGDSVSLSCKLKSQTFASKVFFYRNDKLIQNDTRRELNISAVSKSDEGFYKCEYSQKVSAQSWMSVKGASRPESSSSPVLMIIGLVFGIVLVILLLLLYRYRRSKDSCFIRPVQSESTNRGFATSHMVNQNEAQQNEDPSLLRGDSHLYEPVKDSEARLYEPVKGSEAPLYESIKGSEAPLYESIKGSEARLYESIKRSEDADNVLSTLLYGQDEVSNKATVTVQPNWPKIFSGEKMTLRCEIQGGGDTGWTYEWSTPSGYTRPTQKDYIISSATENHSGKYRCMGRRDLYSSTQWSDVITLEVLSYRPRARLSAVNRDIPVGGSVTLICSVNPSSSSGWKYFWYRGEKTSKLLASQDIVFLSDGQIRVSQGGLYWCRGGRGDPVYYTEYSGSIYINKINIPQPVLTVSPLWLTPGASVTLNCSVEHPSAGWRFFWYKAVPKLSDNSYSYELIPGSITGTEQDSYIVDGQTHTAGYVCRAGRGDPVYYTHYSGPKFVWSGDVHSSASLMVSPDRVQHFTTDSVSLNCEGNSTEWRVKKLTESGNILFCQNWGTMTGSTCSIERYRPSNAVYWCESGSGEFSNAVNITISSNHIILVSPVHPVTEGDSVSLSCRIRSQTFASKVFFYRNDKLIQNDTRRELNISAVSKSDEGFYKCEYSQKVSAQSWMSVKVLSTLLYGQDEGGDAVLESPAFTVFEGDSVTMRCKHRNPSNDMEAAFFKDGSPLVIDTNHQSRGAEMTIHSVSKSDEGKYTCKFGDRTKSEARQLRVEVSNKATVTLHPDWPQIFRGEKMTLRCEIQGGGDTGWTYEWRTTSPNTLPAQKEYTIDSATEYHRGQYSCIGRRVSYSSTQWSDVIALEILSSRPWARLSADNGNIPVGGSVMLTCSVDLSSSSSSSSSSSGWKYFWYRGEKTSELLASQDVSFLSDGQISVSQGGLYWCRGGRGDPVYYTEYSGSIRINKIISNKATVTLHPNWPQIFSGEKMTVRCEIQGGGDTGWTYEWRTPSQYTPPTGKDYIISSATEHHSGEYRCVGRRGSYSSTQWSDVITLTVLYKPQPVLTVSPLWLSPGASVTLNCSVEHPSAGWRFFWYKAVPKLSDNSYSYELIPGSINGTEQDSYIVDGQTHTAGYVCRAGRGDPVYYTQYSGPKFVWSGDVHSSASLMVSPDRVQHFTSDSVSLNCEGNSTEWRVKLTESGNILFCQNWGTMTGSTCSIEPYWPSNAVYWCESGSGEFSNAVNITISSNHIILVSPVRPVTEGDSVSLSCELKSQTFASKVFFYQNDKLIQNDTRRELNISAVSKSDEGFYKCEYSQKVSAQSWMSVEGE
ncbi:hypothetical protein ABVT39_010918 [Epinephelus coioides]